MFEWLRKTKTEKSMDEFLKTLGLTLKSSIEELKNHSLENQKWGKEFHRLLINEYAQYPQNKVYAIIYLDNRNHSVRRITLVAADTFEKAQTAGSSILQAQNENPSDWTIEGYESIFIPLADKSIEKKLNEVDKKMNDTKKPIGVFINDLMLVRDKFAETPSEKRSLSSIINRISNLKYEKGRESIK